MVEHIKGGAVVFSHFLALIVSCFSVPLEHDGYRYSPLPNNGVRVEYQTDDTTRLQVDCARTGLFSFDSLYTIAAYDTEGVRTSLTHAVGNTAHGPSLRYFPDGSIKDSGRFEYGKMVGTWIMYGENGKMRDSSVYVGGDLVRSTSYYPDGALRAVFRYNGGEIDGVTDAYSPDGSIHIRGYWSAGHSDSSIYYNLPEGNKTKRLVYAQNGENDTTYYH